MKFILAFLLLVGSAFAQHSNTLAWPAMVPQGAQVITGYNIYRGIGPGDYMAGLPFATVPFGTNQFTDTKVVTGQTFYYVITGLCSNCFNEESPWSNEVFATSGSGHTVPPSPTGLTVVVH